MPAELGFESGVRFSGLSQRIWSPTKPRTTLTQALTGLGEEIFFPKTASIRGIIKTVIPHQTKVGVIPGSDFKEIHKKALKHYRAIEAKTKRKPYIRSPYFRKEKIFFDYFWVHLFQKSNWQDRVRRLKFLPAAIDLITNSRQKPESKPNPNRKSEILHRFAGLTKEKHLFFIQIKENKRTGAKQLISVFPA